MPTIDSTSYPKDRTYKPGHGYGTRPGPPSAVVVHSTNNSKPNTSFSSEANYLYTSPDVSADYLIGKDGRIVRFLDSTIHQAWHAGGQQSNGTWTAQPAFANPESIGIELHHSTPDPPYPAAQIDALGWLLRNLAEQYNIVPSMIETHGQIAIAGPYLRKTDPDDWPHDQFVEWRDALFHVDPLKVLQLPGVGGQSFDCGTGMYGYYYRPDYDGLWELGLATGAEERAGDEDNPETTYMPFERACLKYRYGEGVRPALLAEAKGNGWI